MHLFVTGASGFIGSAVARRLAADGHRITALARSDTSASALHAAGYEVCRGDITDPQSLRAPAAGADGVIHLAVGMSNGVVDADGVALETIIEAMAGRNAPLLVTSGIAVYAGAGGSSYDEEIGKEEVAPAQAPLHRLEEQTVRATARGIRAVVMRPSSVFGHGRTGSVTRRQIDFAEKNGAAVYVGEGLVPFTNVHVDDVAEGYALALARAPAGAIYNFIGSALITRDLAKAISHAIGIPGRAVSMPPDEARQTFGPMAEMLIARPVISGARATLDLGWTPRAPSLAYELAHGTLRRAPGGSQASV